MKQIQDQLFKVAIYLRLSKDDGDFSSAENGKSESNSIYNQRESLSRIFPDSEETILNVENISKKYSPSWAFGLFP